MQLIFRYGFRIYIFTIDRAPSLPKICLSIKPWIYSIQFKIVAKINFYPLIDMVPDICDIWYQIYVFITFGQIDWVSSLPIKCQCIHHLSLLINGYVD
jgi:hypothetical protein